MRDELLNAEDFDDLMEAKALGKGCRDRYNHNRPHSALEYMAPAVYAAGRRKDGGLWPGGARRELAMVDRHGRVVQWLANKP